ncbi:hypothetical protein NDU88_002887 [Pleurodeles waltl]|uniref:Uncharacterized protein n=1 Tax=Pleurodeles waltl TaxID=8319 RepID=A0AAV7NHS5_PLEWA|nr:hypothetical protein NDU88_002887 [Pleurodeles waltl]
MKRYSVRRVRHKVRCQPLQSRTIKRVPYLAPWSRPTYSLRRSGVAGFHELSCDVFKRRVQQTPEPAVAKSASGPPYLARGAPNPPLRWAVSVGVGRPYATLPPKGRIVFN